MFKNRHLVTGFTSLTDVATTLLNFKSIFLLMVTYAITIAAFIYTPHQLIFTLFALMLMDWGTGTYKAFKHKCFCSYKFQRMLWNIFFTSFLIGTSTMLGKHLWIFSTLKIADLMISGFLLTYLISIIENLHAIDKRIMSDKFFNAINKVLDVDKVISRFFKNEITKEEAKTEVDGIMDGETPSKPE